MEFIRRISDRFMAIQAENAALALGSVGAVIVAAARYHGVLA